MIFPQSQYLSNKRHSLALMNVWKLFFHSVVIQWLMVPLPPVVRLAIEPPKLLRVKCQQLPFCIVILYIETL